MDLWIGVAIDEEYETKSECEMDETKSEYETKSECETKSEYEMEWVMNQEGYQKVEDFDASSSSQPTTQ